MVEGAAQRLFIIREEDRILRYKDTDEIFGLKVLDFQFFRKISIFTYLFLFTSIFRFLGFPFPISFRNTCPALLAVGTDEKERGLVCTLYLFNK